MVSTVKITVEEGVLPGLGRRFDITVRRNTTAAALAGALAAVLRHNHITWSEVIRAERLERLAMKERRPAGGPPPSPSVSPGAGLASVLAGWTWTAGRLPTVPVLPPGTAEQIGRRVSGALAAFGRVMAAGRRAQSAEAEAAGSLLRAPLLPGESLLDHRRMSEAAAGQRAVATMGESVGFLILPAEARAWNLSELPMIHPGTDWMNPELADRFRAWRAARAAGVGPAEVPLYSQPSTAAEEAVTAAPSQPDHRRTSEAAAGQPPAATSPEGSPSAAGSCGDRDRDPQSEVAPAGEVPAVGPTSTPTGPATEEDRSGPT
jgi:hypothetical protein